MCNMGEDLNIPQLNRNSDWSSGACFVDAKQANLQNLNKGLSRDGVPIFTNVMLDETRPKLSVRVAHVDIDECSVMEGPNSHIPIMVKSGCASIGPAGLDAELFLDGGNQNVECNALKTGPGVNALQAASRANEMIELQIVSRAIDLPDGGHSNVECDAQPSPIIDAT
ncbi:sensor histidine kinase KdpD [Sesbania bispinosa]|nr:sensor histidine kinase KdpD [Sesbania bispinosa]